MAHDYGDTDSAIPQLQKIQITSNLPNGSSSFNTGGTKVKTIVCRWVDREDNTPAPQTPFEDGSPYLLTDATQEQMQGGFCRLTLTYTASYTALPDTTYSEQTSQLEVPIQEHPNFADWEDDWDETEKAFKPGTDKYGITSYIKGSSTVTKVEYFSSRPSHRFDDVGTLDTPGGDYTGSNHYLIIGATRSKQGNFWTVTTTYQYSKVEFNSDIYGD